MEQTKIAKAWSEQQMQFARFLAANRIDNEMQTWTQGKFAKSIGVHETTLSDWKRIPGFMQLVSELVPDAIHKFVPAITSKQIKKALEGNNDSARFVLNQADRLKSEKQQVEHEMGENMVDVFGMMRKKAQIINGDFTEADPGTDRVDGGERPANLPARP